MTPSDEFEDHELEKMSPVIEMEPKSPQNDTIDGWNDYHTVPYSREEVRENLKCHGYCCPTDKCDAIGCTRCCCCFDCWYKLLEKIVGPKRNRKRPETIQEWFRTGLFKVQIGNEFFASIFRKTP